MSVYMPFQTYDARTDRADLSVTGFVLDIDRFASHDGPGIRTAVFLKGCPLACAWCHSPESQRADPELVYQSRRCTACWSCIDVCPTGALSRGLHEGREFVVLDRTACTECGACTEVCYPGALTMAGRRVTVGELADDVVRDRAFFESSGGGITVSGGEPAAQPTFTYNFLAACRERNVHTALQTTGYARWEIVSRLSSAADLVMYDVKFIDDTLHHHYTRVSNRQILENLRRLVTEHDNVLVRIPCISGVNDSPEQIGDAARVLTEIGVTAVELMPYNAAAGAKYDWVGRSYAFADRETQTEEYMKRLVEIARERGLTVRAA
ncbi:MAG: glycyl-radical enzyme activating protein [Spirochaetaceae bacterium]|nr:MAG: glycyl-radical enzyme activating protein [Spirochaetaceae bacterium]